MIGSFNHHFMKSDPVQNKRIRIRARVRYMVFGPLEGGEEILYDSDLPIGGGRGRVRDSEDLRSAVVFVSRTERTRRGVGGLRIGVDGRM